MGKGSITAKRTRKTLLSINDIEKTPRIMRGSTAR